MRASVPSVLGFAITMLATVACGSDERSTRASECIGSSATIEFKSQLPGGWGNGAYTLLVTSPSTPSEADSCSISKQGSGDSTQCQSQASLFVSSSEVCSRSTDDATSGGPCPEATPDLLIYTRSTTLADGRYVLKKDGSVVASGDFTLHYECAPDGCDCKFAKTTIAIH